LEPHTALTDASLSPKQEHLATVGVACPGLNPAGIEGTQLGLVTLDQEPQRFRVVVRTGVSSARCRVAPRICQLLRPGHRYARVGIPRNGMPG
jgi:hypothetical protein